MANEDGERKYYPVNISKRHFDYLNALMEKLQKEAVHGARVTKKGVIESGLELLDPEFWKSHNAPKSTS